MRQLPLDLGIQASQTLDSFVVGNNDELLQLLPQYGKRTADERFAYLWGEPSAGKTHLLNALAETAAARFIPATADEKAFAYSPEITLYLLDDCNRLAPQVQVAAFTLFNAVRDHGGFMVTAGSVAPRHLTVRDDLRSRLGWGLVYQVHRLTDEEKLTALTVSAQRRGLILSPGVLPYLITHFARDMRSLSGMLDALDRYSLETQRAITLPLLRDLLEQEAKKETL